METFQRDLTTKQKLFCDFVLQGLNATRAALRAGYSRTTAENGCLMNMPKIKKYLAEHTCEPAGGDVLVSHEMILKQLCKIAFANVQDCFMPDGMLKCMDDIGPDTMSAVESISITAAGDVKIKMYNKMAALEKIAKRIGFYAPALQKPEPIIVTPKTVVEKAIEMPDQDDNFDQPLVIKDAEGYMAGEINDDDAEEDALQEEITEDMEQHVPLVNQPLPATDGGIVVPFNVSAIKPGNPFYNDGWELKSYNCCE